MTQVKKNDGQLVDFDKSKISAVLLSAGMAQTDAESVASQVEEWANTVEGGVVEARDIKEKVLSLVTPEIAEKLRTYIKPTN